MVLAYNIQPLPRAKTHWNPIAAWPMALIPLLVIEVFCLLPAKSRRDEWERRREWSGKDLYVRPTRLPSLHCE